MDICTLSRADRSSSTLVDLLLQELKQERGARAELQETVWRLEAAAAAGAAAQQHAPGDQSHQWRQQQQQTTQGCAATPQEAVLGRCYNHGAAAALTTQGCVAQQPASAAAGISTPRLLPASIAAPSFVCTSPSSRGSSPSSLVLSAAAAQLLSTAAAARVRNSQQLLAESLTLSGSSDDEDDGGSRRGSRQPLSNLADVVVDTDRGAGLAPAWVQPGSCSQAGAAAAVAAAARWAATGAPIRRGTRGGGQPSSADNGDSWPDSWNDEIDAFCARLLPAGEAVADDVPGGGLALLGFAGSSSGNNSRIGEPEAAAAAAGTAASRQPDDDAWPVGLAQQHTPLQQPLQQLAGSTCAVSPTAITSVAGPSAGPATSGGGKPCCQRCEQLSALLLEQELEGELQAAQLSLLSEERDLLALQHESLLQIIVQQQQ